jgi:hypothetical protein
MQKIQNKPNSNKKECINLGKKVSSYIKLIGGDIN